MIDAGCEGDGLEGDDEDVEDVDDVIDEDDFAREDNSV